MAGLSQAHAMRAIMAHKIMGSWLAGQGAVIAGHIRLSAP